MPGKLIGFILILLVIITFIGLNIENTSNISLWFGDKGQLHDVPIFVSFFVMYLIGVLSVIPFLVRWSVTTRRKRKRIAEQSEEKKAEASKAPAADPGPKKGPRILGSARRAKDGEEAESSDTPAEGTAAGKPADERKPASRRKSPSGSAKGSAGE